MSAVEVLREDFASMVATDQELQVLFDGGAAGSYNEGPVWFADLQCLIWSDIPNNRMMRWTSDNHVSVFREPTRFANGNTRDRQGRLVTCEHGSRSVTRTEPDGRKTVIADRYRGRRLNSPNDVVVHSDGTIWFTDPDYGLRQNLPGEAVEQDGDYVFRVDPATGDIRVVADDFVKPNGLAFSPDERTLYVVDSAVTEGPDFPSHIRAFDVGEDSLSGGDVFATTVGIPDGLRTDVHGNVWTSAGPAINCYTPQGELIGRVHFPENVSNLTFGGHQRLFATGWARVYSLRVTAIGAQHP